MSLTMFSIIGRRCAIASARMGVRTSSFSTTTATTSTSSRAIATSCIQQWKRRFHSSPCMRMYDEEVVTEDAPGSPYLQVGKASPIFSGTALIDGGFRDIALSDYLGKWVCLFTFPLAFTYVCPTEINAFSDAADRFHDLNCELIGASVDSKFTLKAWSNVKRNDGGIEGIKIPLLSDITKSVSYNYNVLLEKDGISLRGLFLIDPQGVLRHVTVNDNAVGRNTEEVLRIIEALQFADENGEVCPINWKKGDATINPAKADEFFSKNA